MSVFQFYVFEGMLYPSIKEVTYFMVQDVLIGRQFPGTGTNLQGGRKIEAA